MEFQTLQANYEKTGSEVQDILAFVQSHTNLNRYSYSQQYILSILGLLQLQITIDQYVHLLRFHSQFPSNVTYMTNILLAIYTCYSRVVIIELCAVYLPVHLLGFQFHVFRERDISDINTLSYIYSLFQGCYSCITIDQYTY